jgi:hypothetical protein
LIIGAASCAGCLDHGLFRCGADADCTSSGTTGACEPTGFCSFADSTCPDSGRRYGRWAEPSLSLTCVPSGGTPGTVFEPFDWQGDHAATLLDGDGGAVSNSVWWDENRWDTRARTFWLGLQDKTESIAVERSNADPTDGELRAGKVEINGDGSPGVGVIRLGGWSVVSARLRNPALVGTQEPLVVDLFAELALGVGHAWELVLTPTATVRAAEYGVVAHGRVSDPVPSLALAIKTSAYYPCEYGWDQDLTLDTTLDAAGERFAEQSIKRSYSDDFDHLTHWRFEFTAAGVEVYLGDSGTPSHFASFAVSIPWSEVYVNLVASSTDWEHSDDACGDYFQSKRLVRFKNVMVTPVRYQETAVVPHQEGEERVPIDTGWVGQDVRDLDHSGNAEGHNQPNQRPYDQETSHAFCNGCSNSVAKKSLHATIDDVSGLARAQLLYDLHGAGSPTLTVNEDHVVTISGRSAPEGEAYEPQEWVRFSADINIEWLQKGDNHLVVALPEGVYANTLQIELAYGDLTD